MSNTIEYNSEELYETVSIIEEAKKILAEEIKTSLDSDFSDLVELNLFSEGLSKLKSQAASLIDTHENLIASLKTHDAEIGNTETETEQIIRNYQVPTPSGSGSSGYSGSSVASGEVTTEDVVKGNEINNTVLKEILPQLDYSSHLQILKNIMIYNEGNVTNLLFEPSMSNHLVYLLKKMMTDDAITKDPKATNETIDIQKVLLRSIANDKNNAFSELDDETVLVAIKHFDKFAKSNNLDVADLLLDEKNQTVLFKEIKNIYENKNTSDMSQNELNKFKKYIDTIAGKNNMTSEELLSNEKNMTIIRKGVIN